MTSFDFAVSCGKCHPGGGALEFDRKGNRYDHFAADSKNNITSGASNNFDGDYFKARWAETGVLEADCLMCHMTGYNMKERNKQLSALNFRWAATAGAGLAAVKNAVKNSEQPSMQYNAAQFDAQGRLNVPMIKEVPTHNCLFCHMETDWKKKGTSYSHRFDVHLRAGMKCIECHPAGKNAGDTRINSHEEHNFGKGDDPGALVRDDLDNTVVTCRQCHEQGLHRAPRMQHASFSDGSFSIHDAAMDCLVCHVPEKAVKAALVQDSAVFNPQTRTDAIGLKRIWSFYGPDVLPWNYYGANNFTKGEKPWFFYSPQLRRYKDKMYPVNSVYSIWFGLKIEGTSGLDQVFMKDIWAMFSEIDAYPGLEKIRDDNGDGFLEINTSAEIGAAIGAMRDYLSKNGKLGNRTVVLVAGDEVYTSGTQKALLTKEPFEYSPYASTFKLAHDVAPASAALGAGGCIDCHRKNAPFFTRPCMKKPFDTNGNSVFVPAYTMLGYSDDEAKALQLER